MYPNAREYLWLLFWIAVFAVSSIFIDYERYVVVLFAVACVAWLVLKIVTDRQEQKLYDEIGQLSDENYEQFLDDAEKEGLVEKRKE